MERSSQRMQPFPPGVGCPSVSRRPEIRRLKTAGLPMWQSTPLQPVGVNANLPPLPTNRPAHEARRRSISCLSWQRSSASSEWVPDVLRWLSGHGPGRLAAASMMKRLRLRRAEACRALPHGHMLCRMSLYPDKSRPSPGSRCSRILPPPRPSRGASGSPCDIRVPWPCSQFGTRSPRPGRRCRRSLGSRCNRILRLPRPCRRAKRPPCGRHASWTYSRLGTRSPSRVEDLRARRL